MNISIFTYSHSPPATPPTTQHQEVKGGLLSKIFIMLTDSDIIQFQKLYKEQFGADITRENAYEQGLKLVTLMLHVYKPMTKQESDRIDLHREKRKSALGNRLSI